MVTREDFIMRPVMRGLLQAESLVNGAVDLAYVFVLNDAIDVHDENDRRATEAEINSRA